MYACVFASACARTLFAPAHAKNPQARKRMLLFLTKESNANRLRNWSKSVIGSSGGSTNSGMAFTLPTRPKPMSQETKTGVNVGQMTAFHRCSNNDIL